MKAEQKHFDYLVKLRDSNVTNMWRATPYVARKFAISDKDATDIVVEWIRSFRRESEKSE